VFRSDEFGFAIGAVMTSTSERSLLKSSVDFSRAVHVITCCIKLIRSLAGSAKQVVLQSLAIAEPKATGPVRAVSSFEPLGSMF